MSRMDRGDMDTRKYPYLASLNDAQLRAVTAPPDVPLQILAGPGSGKTRVLTSRVAHLVRCHGYAPWTITAVTFTNKAAAEMRKRLIQLLGEEQAKKLVLGTFHATCVRYLRRHGVTIGLSDKFTIADADDCKKIIARLIKDRQDELEEAHIQLKEAAVLSEISKAKAKGETPDMMASRAQKAMRKLSAEDMTAPDVLGMISKLYIAYQAELKKIDALDFDDLLVRGLELFKTDPSIIGRCRHILVDEFQDTNTTQYELMKCFATANPKGGVSIVGDPDQSIYGWRSAEVENLDHMLRDFPATKAIHLEENYRSTGAILAASHSIVSQDPHRIKKDLYTSHPQSTPVTLKLFATPTIEASYIATEIKRMVAYSGEMLNYEDFAILLRNSALSRLVESALQKEKIPSRLISGHKFFERMEVKDILSYLQLADNPNFNPAFLRVMKITGRGLGPKSVEAIVELSKQRGLSHMEVCRDIASGVSVPKDLERKVSPVKKFAGVIDHLRSAALMGANVAQLIEMILLETGYQAYLEKMPDGAERLENVNELISFSVSVAKEAGADEGKADEGKADTPNMEGFLSAKELVAKAGNAQEQKPSVDKKPRLHSIFQNAKASSSSRSTTNGRKGKAKPLTKLDSDGTHMVLDSDDSDDAIEEFDNRDPPRRSESSDTSDDGLTPLRLFLQSSMLATDTESSDDSEQVPKVTMATIHSSKGLEWPVVFIPAVEHGTIPSARCVEEREIAEERRLLYVAMTRAQIFLTLTHSMSRMVAGETQDRNLSEFVDRSMRKNPKLVTSSMPTIDAVIRKQMSKMIRRPLLDEKLIEGMIKDHVRAAPPLSTWDAPDSNRNRFARHDGGGALSRGFDYWATDVDDYAPGGPSGPRSGFVSARSAMTPKGAPAAPKPHVERLQSSLHTMPKTAFPSMNKDTVPQDTSLARLAIAHKESLTSMLMLGIPEDSKPGSSAGSKKPSVASRGLTSGSNMTRAGATAGSPFSLAGAYGNASRENNSVSGAGSVRPANSVSGLAMGQTSASAGTPGAPSIPPRGTKRALGMRPRFNVPWDNKRGKTEDK